MNTEQTTSIDRISVLATRLADEIGGPETKWRAIVRAYLDEPEHDRSTDDLVMEAIRWWWSCDAAGTEVTHRLARGVGPLDLLAEDWQIARVLVALLGLEVRRRPDPSPIGESGARAGRLASNRGEPDERADRIEQARAVLESGYLERVCDAVRDLPLPSVPEVPPGHVALAWVDEAGSLGVGRTWESAFAPAVGALFDTLTEPESLASESRDGLPDPAAYLAELRELRPAILRAWSPEDIRGLVRALHGEAYVRRLDESACGCPACHPDRADRWRGPPPSWCER